MSPLIRFTACALLLSVFAACAQNSAPTDVVLAPDTTCARGSAQIAIGDGYQEILCGCAEQGGQVVASGGTPITCTVAVGTQIFFYYQATHLRHQVIPSDGSFPPSELSDPTPKAMVRAHAFPVNTAGSYNFTDAFDSGIVGRIVAQ